MIDKTMSFLLGELNTFLGTVFPTGEPHAVLSDLASPDGGLPPGTDNKIVLTLVNIERDGIAYSPEAASGNLRLSAPLNLNLYILLSANFPASYADALRLLSSAIGFLQTKPGFTPSSGAGFPRGLERLTLEIVNLGVHELHQIWTITGVRYRPSILYKARMITIGGGWISERLPAVTATDPRIAG